MLKETHRWVFYVGKVVKGRQDIPKKEKGPNFTNPNTPGRWWKLKKNQILLLIPWAANTFMTRSHILKPCHWENMTYLQFSLQCAGQHMKQSKTVRKSYTKSNTKVSGSYSGEKIPISQNKNTHCFLAKLAFGNKQRAWQETSRTRPLWDP